MNELDEIKKRVFGSFKTSSDKSIHLIEKLMKGEYFSRQEVDGVIDSIGKYQAFVICLLQHAKA